MSDKQTAYLRKLYRDNPTIASQLPIGFPAQKVSWHDMAVSCGNCGRALPNGHTHGTVSQMIPSVITVEAVSFCTDCMLLIHGIYRFRSDGSMEFTKDGKWMKTYGVPTSWWPRLVARLKLLKPLWENFL